MESMYVRQPVGPNNKYTGFLLVLKSVSPSLSEGAGSMLPGLAGILHLKKDRNVYILINLFILVSKKPLNFKWKNN